MTFSRFIRHAALLGLALLASGHLRALPSGTQTVLTTSGFSDTGATLVGPAPDNDFLLSARNEDTSAALSLNIAGAGNGQGAFITGASGVTYASISVAANTTTLSTFELTGLVFDEFITNNNYQITVIGTRADNSTISSDTAVGTGTGGSSGGGSGPDTYTVNLGNFAGVQIKSFTVIVDGRINGRPGISSATVVGDFSLVSFSVANAQAPDTSPPSVVGITSSTANGAYKAGDLISIQVALTESVTVTGTPQLTLETGTVDRVVNYASGSGTSVLTFNYTVQAGDSASDLDYASTSALALNSGSIRDAASNNALLTLPTPGASGSLSANKAIVVDTTAPSVSIGAPSSSLTRAGPVTFTVTYSDAQLGGVTLGAGDITLVSTGSATGSVGVSGSGGTRTVTLSSITGDGTLRISLGAATALDTAGNFAASAGPSSSITVDNTPPVVTSPTTASGTFNTAFNYTVTAIGVPVSYGASGLPSGLTIDPGSGAISGTPIQAGSFSVTLSATDFVGNVGTALLDLSIAKAAATVTLTGLAQTYDGTARVVGATTNPGGLTVNLTYAGSPTAPTAAGTYAIVGTIDDAGYQGLASGTLEVAKATLTVTADAKTRPYGVSNPALSASFSGFALGDNAGNSVTGAPTLSTTAVEASAPGPYTIGIALGSLAATNYDFTLNDGTLTVRLVEFADWQEQHFTPSELLDAGVSGAAADPDLDGVNNLREYAFGTDPNNLADGPAALVYTGSVLGGGSLDAVGQPRALVEVSGGATLSRVLFIRRVPAFTGDLDYTVQFTSNLSTWVDSAAVPTVLATDGAHEVVVIPYQLVTGGRKTRAFRVVPELVP
jgi:hypothetical protein